jgi:geranylgeranyl diphosphate synthase type II
LRNAPVVIAFRDCSRAAASAPLRFLDAPGIALLRQNISWLQTETNPLPTHLERISRAAPRSLYALFGPDRLKAALSACQRLAALGRPAVAVRGRLVPAEALGDFDALSFAPGFLPVLAESGQKLPANWVPPIVLLEPFQPRVAGIRLGALFSRIPEPAALDLADLFAGERDAAAGPGALPEVVEPSASERLLSEFRAAGAPAAAIVDLGGDAHQLALLAARERMLGGWIGRAARPIPDFVIDSGCAIWTWFEPEDLMTRASSRGPRLRGGVAFLPVGLPGEGIPEATARVLELRELGYSAVIPRYHVPVPNSAEWRDWEGRFGLRNTRLEQLAGDHLVFRLPEWARVEGPEVLELLRRGNRFPDVAREAGIPRRSISFETLRQSLDTYLADAAERVPSCHAQDLMHEVRRAVPGGPLVETDQYPFVALGDQNLLDLVQRAIEGRLLSLAELPAELLAAIRHAAFAGGKRIRPVLTLVMTSALGVPLEAAMPAALATEWLHTASLIQDDMPCMDDDDIRRRDVATHRRHGEGIALLASDALIALSVDDLAALRKHPAVGPDKAARLLAETARTLGGEGLVGGQVRDLITRRLPQVTLQDVLDVHRRKTVPLFRLTARYATILAGSDAGLSAKLADMLASMGLAFQIVDDVLDATPNNDAFGRPSGSDDRNALPTFATLIGSKAARRYAERLMAPYTTLARGQPGLFGLEKLSRYVLERAQ